MAQDASEPSTCDRPCTRRFAVRGPLALRMKHAIRRQPEILPPCTHKSATAVRLDPLRKYHRLVHRLICDISHSGGNLLDKDKVQVRSPHVSAAFIVPSCCWWM